MKVDNERLRRTWRQVEHWYIWKPFTPVRIVGIVLLAGMTYLIYHKYGLDWQQIEAHLFDNVVTDFLGLVFAVLVIDGLNEWRINREHKRAIIRQMASNSNDFALEAVRIAKIEGWHTDRSLQGAVLMGANLQRMCLVPADLQNAFLIEANLQGALLVEANLQKAMLVFANLQEADLSAADLREAWLQWTNLHKARLLETNLCGASLGGADLRGVILDFARFDNETILPDRTLWTPDTDMTRFTNPDHPKFWREDDLGSPFHWDKENKLHDATNPAKLPRKRKVKKTEDTR